MDITKKELYSNDIESNFHDVNYLRNNINDWNDELHKKRQLELKQRLELFFRNPNEN